jgi:L-aspartate oxidase
MKRYIQSGDLRDVARIDTDVVIVGCGAAGLYTALNLDPGLRCVVLNKDGAENCNSMYAQGGIAAVLEPSELDDPEQHFTDTLTAGAGLCDKKAVRVLVDEAQSNIEELIEIGVPFDRRGDKLLLTREGGHGRDRILHCGGDATGLHMTSSLLEAAKKRENITILDRMTLTDILTSGSGVAGALALDGQDHPCYFAATKVVIASGGIGQVYLNSTNAICATGDGIAAAHRAGARLKDMEFVQFHPTAFLYPFENGRFFLISEALRGEGAVLRNHLGEPFMQGQHPLADLAPRDIVSRAIAMEMRKTEASHVYLDITMKSGSFLQNRFPTIYENCLLHHIDIAKDWIPVIPLQHYFMGGIRTDVFGRTNIEGLYACGEAACTGVHGANRLASNSLLECLVFGRRCARHINGSGVSTPTAPEMDPEPFVLNEYPDFEAYSTDIRMLMTQKCGIVREGEELAEAHSHIRKLFRRLDVCRLETRKGVEAYNRAQIAMEVLRAAQRRKKNVGAHYRCDDEGVRRKENARSLCS